MKTSDIPSTGFPVLMRRPRVKPEHAPYRIGGNRIRIGGVSYGTAAEITDRAGWVWTLLQSMDGTRSPAGLVDEVARQHPGESRHEVRQGLDQLIEAGYVEDAGAPDPAGLTERDKQRHERARGYYRWLDLTPRRTSWEPQARLRQARVTVIGIGGTGGAAALALAAAGVGRLHCVDPDIVELSNLSRQVIYAEPDIGRPKAEAAVARLRALNTDIKVSGERLLVESVTHVRRLAEDCDVLLLTADQPPEVREWANQACLDVRRPWVDAGYHGPLVQVGHYVPGTGACRQCLFGVSWQELTDLGMNFSDAPRRWEAVGAATAAVPAGISGYLSAHRVISLLTGVPPAAPGRIEAVNLAALDAPFTLTRPPQPDCPACAGQP
jgi:molybdopterin/thiamine biosynthesis adenylyltransferase